MEKILQIYLSYLKSLYIVLFFEVAQIIILDEIIYILNEMKLMKEFVKEKRELKNSYSQFEL